MGEIRNWNQLGGPDKEILVVDKEPSRGTRHVFMKAVLGDKEAVTPGADLVLGANNEEQTAIAQSTAAIGMLSHAWLNEDVTGLAIILEDGRLIEPSLDNVINGSFRRLSFRLDWQDQCERRSNVPGTFDLDRATQPTYNTIAYG